VTGKQLAKRMKELELNQVELASILGLTQPAVSDLLKKPEIPKLYARILRDDRMIRMLQKDPP
jgi:predicted transcriptional regulator